MDAPIPLLIEFARGTTLQRERDHASDLPIHRNGPPGTFVTFPGRFKVSLPTDQVVFAADDTGAARVGFGGMHFAGVEGGLLLFLRVREMLPEEQLSPARSRRMLLRPEWVASVEVNGTAVWPQQ